MKKASIAVVTLIAALVLWMQQRESLQNTETTTQTLAEQVAEMTTLIESKESELEAFKRMPIALEKQLEVLRETQDTLIQESEKAAPHNLPAPDPKSQGGWPTGTDYLFLSKQYLTNAHYKLLEGDRLTTEATRLLGMTADERESVDRTFNELLGRFGQLEIESMEKVEPPATWGINDLIETDSQIVYQIPDLHESMGVERVWFDTQISELLGPSRAAILKDASDTYIRQNLDSLGSGQRTIGFFWEPKPDGTHDVWYAISGDRFGPGSFNRINKDYDRESQMAYYARLLGVDLPSK